MGKIMGIKTWFVFPCKLNLRLMQLIVITEQREDICAAFLHHLD